MINNETKITAEGICTFVPNHKSAPDSERFPVTLTLAIGAIIILGSLSFARASLKHSTLYAQSGEEL